MDLIFPDNIVYVDESTRTQEEIQLAQQLKQICDENGAEKNVRNSALVLHQLGNAYQSRSPDKFSLIRSAALYNAAIFRGPYNVAEIENDLEQLCKHILFEANAENQKADLIGKSKLVKHTLIEWRKKIEQQLSAIQQIPEDADSEKILELERAKICDIRSLQNDITKTYLAIMIDIAAYCERVMGEPPFTFAIAGLGSLAKKEITPFSDFEHIILLSNDASISQDYGKKLNYFRWFTVLFQIVVINLQETILPSVSIYSLNNDLSNFGNWFYDGFTPRGISFDGMMVHASKFPLGRLELTKNKPWKTELIKPVDEMLSYLSSEENLKNGYRLSDVLTKTCFVYKDKDIFDQFQQGVFRKVKSDVENGTAFEDIKRELSEDLANFSARISISKLKTEDQLNVKRVVYRSSTLFISALGKINNISASSSFEIIEELANRKVISKHAEDLLMYAIAIACEIRLRWYFENKQQCDKIKTNAISKLLRMVGKKSTTKYFQIAYALQCDIARRMKLKKKYFYTNPKLFSMSIGRCFVEYDHLRKFSFQQNNLIISNDRLFTFDECMQIIDLSEDFESDDKSLSDHELAKSIQQFALKLFQFGLYDDAVECFDYVLALHQQKQGESTGHAATVASNYFLMGTCMKDLGKHQEAFQFFEKSMSIFQEGSPDSADSQHWIGRCLLQMKKYKQAVWHLKRSLEIKQREFSDWTTSNDVACKGYWVGVCLAKMKKTRTAMNYLKRSLIIKRKISMLDLDIEYADILFWCGKCLYSFKTYFKNNYEPAFDCFKKSLEIKRQASNQQDLSRKIAETLYWLGQCSKDLKNYDEAVSYFAEALEINEQTSADAFNDKRIAKTQLMLGEALLKINKADDAIPLLENVLAVSSRIYPDSIFDGALFIAQKLLYHCCLDLKNPEKALELFEKLLQVEERASSGKSNDRDVITSTLGWITKCLLDLNKSYKAEKYFKKSFIIKRQTLPYKVCWCKNLCWCIQKLRHGMRPSTPQNIRRFKCSIVLGAIVYFSALVSVLIFLIVLLNQQFI